MFSKPEHLIETLRCIKADPASSAASERKRVARLRAGETHEAHETHTAGEYVDAGQEAEHAGA